MIMKPIPARLDVFIARKASEALILRRGPTKQVCTIGWDLKTDEFKIGQWFKGRIYERFCDISPDGKYFIYFATKGRNSRFEDKEIWSWTAVSKAPFLKAICLWENGPIGGGLFRTNRSYWVNDPFELLIDSAEVRRDAREPPKAYKETWRSPYFYRLVRDGWIDAGTRIDRFRARVAVFEKRINGRFTLLRVAHNAGFKRDGVLHEREEYLLADRKMKGEEKQLPWDWAEPYRGRLLWVETGKLFSARIGKETIGKPVMLRDFNDMKFEELKAPY